jgi:hypothetical protein
MQLNPGMNLISAVRYGPEKAMRIAVACLTSNRSDETKTRLVTPND